MASDVLKETPAQREPAAGSGAFVRHGDDRPRPAFFDELRAAGVEVASDLPLIVPSKSEPRTDTSLATHLAHRAIALPVPVWAALDVVLAFVCVRFAHFASPSTLPPSGLPYHLNALAAVYGATLFLCSYAFSLYARTTFDNGIRVARVCITSSFVALGLTTLAFSWVRFLPIGRYVLLYTFLTTSAAMTLLRLVTRALAGRSRLRVLFVGHRAMFRQLGAAIEKHYGALYAPPEYLELGEETNSAKVERILAEYEARRPDEIVIEEDADLLLELLESSAPIVAGGTVLRSLWAMHEDLLHEVPLEAIDCRTLIGGGLGVGRQSTETVKRIFDVVAALLGLLVTLPFTLVIALVLKLFGGGHVFYRQERVGRFGRRFRIVKFRTMRLDAEQHGAAWATVDDPRITAIGRFLRRTRLDELPQLWNVLRGEMSLVGPRPERPEFVMNLQREIPYYQLRLLVPPGLTGWAQIQYPYGASLEDARRKLSFDLYYIRHYGFLFDAAICLHTLLAMARGSR